MNTLHPASATLLVAALGSMSASATAQGLGNYYRNVVPANLKVAMVPIQFDDQTAPAFSDEAVNASRNALEMHLHDNMYAAGASVDIIFDDPVQKTEIRLPQAHTAYTDPVFWNAGAKVYEDLRNHSAFNVAAYDYVIVLVSKFYAASAPNGFGQEGMPISFVSNSNAGDINNTNSNPFGDLALHELGHQMVLDHARFRLVANGSSDPLGPLQELVNYGDRYDPMASRHQIEPLVVPNPYHLNPRYKVMLGVLGEQDVYSANTGGTHYVWLQATEFSPGTVFGTKMALKARRTAWEEWYVFYRAPLGPSPGGLMVTKTLLGAGTMLLDMTPNSLPDDEDWYDAALPEGQSFTDPVANVKLTNVSADEGKVLVKLQWLSDDVPADRQPVVDLTSPTWGVALTDPSVTYTATAYDPDVGTANGDGIAGVNMTLYKLDNPENTDIGRAVTSQSFTAPPYTWTVDLGAVGGAEPRFAYRLQAVATSSSPSSNPAVQAIHYFHWYLP